MEEGISIWSASIFFGNIGAHQLVDHSVGSYLTLDTTSLFRLSDLIQVLWRFRYHVSII